MLHSYSFVLLTVMLGQAGGDKEKQIQEGPRILRGQVVDVFDDDRILLSFGKDRGARKGLFGVFCRDESAQRFLGNVQFVEVGAKHSVVRFTIGPVGDLYVKPNGRPLAIPVKQKLSFKEGDAILVWPSLFPLLFAPPPRLMMPLYPRGVINDIRPNRMVPYSAGGVIDDIGPNRLKPQAK